LLAAPPSGILDALHEKVDSGEWTEETALIQSLRLFTGETRPEDLYVVVPGDLEGTGLVAEAMAYLETGADEQAKAEIERLVQLVAPDPDDFLDVSVEVDSFSRQAGSPGLARPSDLQIDCSELWTDGFPEAPGAVCFEYKTVMYQGLRIRVFGPASPGTDWGSQSGYAQAAEEGVKDSLQRFGQFAVAGNPAILGNVDVVFTLTDKPKADALAIVPFKTAVGASCRMVLYPISILDNEAKKSSPQDFDVFQQTVAHEMFHCFTAWNYPAHWKAAFKGEYDSMDWWIEGAAEYFSNVVYPKTNEEWWRFDEWRVNSATLSVIDMSYENFGFFQFLGNVLGDNGLLSLLAITPTSGGEAGQTAGLAAYPGMDKLFDDYARAFLDGTIQDTGGGAPLSGTPAYVAPAFRLDIAAPQTFPLFSPPFVLTRYGMTFHTEKKYLLSPVVSGASGLDAARPRNAPGAWTDLPPIVAAACDEVKYYFLMTSTTEAGGTFDIQLSVTTEDGVGCDPCLIGTWDLNLTSFTEYSEAPFAETPDFYTFDAAGGLWRYRFRPDGTFGAAFDFLYASTLHQAGAGFGADIDTHTVVTIVGSGEGAYLSDGLSNLTFTLIEDNVGLSSTTTINGEDIGDLFDALSGYGFLKDSDSMVYSCDAEAGILQLDIAPQAGLPPLQFDRISTDPSKP
jgi:hypothetical protein